MHKDELITVIGAGSWGTALAIKFAERAKRVDIVCNDQILANAINTHHHNIKHIQNIILASNINAVENYDNLHNSSLIIIATPSVNFVEVIDKIHLCNLSTAIPIIIACKGLVRKNNKVQFSSDYLSSKIANKFAIIAGPNFAKEVAEDKPAEANIAMQDINDATEIATKYSLPNFSLIPINDVITIQVSGILKNIIAIKSGMMHASKAGENAKASLIVGGLKEIGYIAKRISAKRLASFPENNLQQTGILGDLILTCNSTTSRNTRFGYDLFKLIQAGAEKKQIKSFVKKYPMLIEGLQSARLIKDFLPEIFAAKNNAELPITSEIVDLLT